MLPAPCALALAISEVSRLLAPRLRASSTTICTSPGPCRATQYSTSLIASWIAIVVQMNRWPVALIMAMPVCVPGSIPIWSWILVKMLLLFNHFKKTREPSLGYCPRAIFSEKNLKTKKLKPCLCYTFVVLILRGTVFAPLCFSRLTYLMSWHPVAMVSGYG